MAAASGAAKGLRPGRGEWLGERRPRRQEDGLVLLPSERSLERRGGGRGRGKPPPPASSSRGSDWAGHRRAGASSEKGFRSEEAAGVGRGSRGDPPAREGRGNSEVTLAAGGGETARCERTWAEEFCCFSVGLSWYWMQTCSLKREKANTAADTENAASVLDVLKLT
ncbi:Hypothetical predicted protein [Podarcis lilfordi]|uniref:Uncharacterized protein n=1 Tax=Podarcis lilfordi TaxID=74358 RepID=A0AA35KEC1_9SAUR|nr:Hypothetical predicted protein [Podarcis lilfordi]